MVRLRPRRRPGGTCPGGRPGLEWSRV